jgi:hypothetical protein
MRKMKLSQVSFLLDKKRKLMQVSSKKAAILITKKAEKHSLSGNNIADVT